ncbi:MAG: sensor histidine kinase [Bryobacteraceae bacterium]|nr:sensor histidine kinase [Bryobacteraceae bacterium]
MAVEAHIGVLADAAASLSPQFELDLRRMAAAIAPLVEILEARFVRVLNQAGHDKQRKAALCAITAGGAARMIHGGRQLDDFLEEVQYRGRRLAKLGLAPADVVFALGQYDELLNAELRKRKDLADDTLARTRSQLHFLVVVALNTAFYQVREAESRAFYELFRVEVESTSLNQMLARFIEILSVFTNSNASRVYLPDGHSKRWVNVAVQPEGEPAGELEVAPLTKRMLAKPRCFQIDEGTAPLCVDAVWASQFQTCWSIPFKSEGALRGVMQFFFAKHYDWLPRELDLLLAAAERCWLAAEKARLLEDLSLREEQVRRLASHMVEVEESERRRISRELHDEAGQSLLCVRLQLELIEHELPDSAKTVRQRLTEARDLTEHTILEIRRLIAALSPAILEQMGLAAALRQLVGRFRRLHPAEVQLHLPRVIDLPKKVEIIVYRLVQEIFNNIAKYSLASGVNLWMESVDGYLKLHVEDDGVGFDVREAFSRRECYGLSGIRERVALLGGALAVSSKPRAASQSDGPGLHVEEDLSFAGRIGIDRPGTAISIELPINTTAAQVDGEM